MGRLYYNRTGSDVIMSLVIAVSKGIGQVKITSWRSPEDLWHTKPSEGFKSQPHSTSPTLVIGTCHKQPKTGFSYP